eukprot:5200560-Heterocapsa_arctica.AAC.1
MSALRSATRLRCFATPRRKLMRCQLLPAVQGIDAITCAPGWSATSLRAASTVSSRLNLSAAV